MNPVTTTSAQPISHDWRRRSLVRVRRPAWAAQQTAVASAREAQSPSPEAAAKPHTTHNDIAW
jgi:hypothetical protein